MISADMAHALHPNYVEKHDPTNHPVINGGPVIKINANQKYITDGDSAAVFKTICKMAGVPCQEFVNHSDMAGGSTLEIYYYRKWKCVEWISVILCGQCIPFGKRAGHWIMLT